MSDGVKKYEVKITRELKGSEVFNLVTVALAARRSWVVKCKWAPETLDAFERQYDKDEGRALDEYLDNVDLDTVLMDVHMEDEDSDGTSTFIVKLTLRRILEGFALLQQQHPRIAATLVNGDGDASDEDCLVQCIAYRKVVFG